MGTARMQARLRILVVDNNELMLEAIGGMLAAEYDDVVGLSDPWEASVLVETERFDGVFLDLNLPGLDGLDLTRQIRASVHNANTPVVVVTGRAGAGAMKDAFSAGAQFFLSKPLDPAKLRRLISTTRGTLLRERSRNGRVPLAVEIKCRAESDSFTGMTSHLSEQDMVLTLDGALHPGELVLLTFRVPTSPRMVEVMAAVVRTDAKGWINCQFKKLDEDARKAVGTFLASIRGLEVDGHLGSG